MTSIVNVAESYIDNDDMSNCTDTLVESETYKETQKFIDNFVTQYKDLHYLYVLTVKEKDNGKVVMAVCSGNTADEYESGEAVTLGMDSYWYPEEVINQLDTILKGDKDVFFFEESEWGLDYTLARPLIDSNGKHYALLCVDVASETLDGAIRKIVGTSIALIGGIGVFFSFLLVIWMYYNVIKPIKTLQTSVSSFVDSRKDEYDLDQLIYQAPSSRGGKEISNLYSSIENMTSDMRKYVTHIIEREKEVKHLQASVEEISEVAMHDALTGVLNKAAYDKEVSIINKQIANKEDISFAVVMIDVNDLKGINDGYGHEAGDIYILGAVNVVKEVYKDSPIYRVGGDEIIVILREKDYQNRDILLKSLKDKFITLSRNNKAKEYEKYSAAAGMGVYEPSEDKSVQSVFHKADKAMYKNKTEMKQ